MGLKKISSFPLNEKFSGFSPLGGHSGLLPNYSMLFTQCTVQKGGKKTELKVKIFNNFFQFLRQCKESFDLKERYRDKNMAFLSHEVLRINTEEKAKVVAAIWGTELTLFLALASVFYLFRPKQWSVNCF